MKRTGFLVERIADRRNLELAFWKASLGRRNAVSVRRFASNLDCELFELHRQIVSGNPPSASYHRFTVFDPKQRTIHAAPFHQRVVHHAIMNVCGEHFERGAVSASCACRIGKGNRHALEIAARLAGRFSHCLKMDIRKYFDSVDHNILKSRFRTVFKDRRLLELLDRIVDDYCASAGRGLPIGTLTSQYFANFYLDPLDRFITEKLGMPGYVRFMDDFVVWGDSASELANTWTRVADWLNKNLKLQLKGQGLGSAAPCNRVHESREGIVFLGFRILPGRILLSKAARKRFISKLRMLDTEAYGCELDSSAICRMQSLVAHVEQGDGLAWRRRAMAGLFP